MLHKIGIGASLWAFTRKLDGRYALAAELVISAKTMNPRGFRYGPYRVWGDLQRSRYFQVDEQPDISLVIRGLSVGARADVLCQICGWAPLSSYGLTYAKHITCIGSVAEAMMHSRN